jgi:hypothetical protein
MRLSRVRIENVRGLNDVSGSFVASDGATATVVAIQGTAGKTRFLETIIAAKEAVAPYGRGDALANQARDASKPIVVHLTFGLDESERLRFGNREALLEVEVIASPAEPPRLYVRDLVQLLGSYAHRSTTSAGAFGIFDYLPDDRNLPTPPADPPKAPSEAAEKTLRLRRHPRKYASLWGVLAEKMRGAVATREAEVRDAGFALIDDETEVATLMRRDFSLLNDTATVARCSWDPFDLVFSRGGSEFGSASLSSGGRQALLVALNHWMLPSRGSVLFWDTPELNQSDESALHLVQGLRALAPGMQLLVATHSKAILNDTPVVIEVSA